MYRTFQLLVVIAAFILVTSCSTNNRQVSITKLCPAFEEPIWQAISSPNALESMLINKQKFAVMPEHKVFWFKAREDYLGMCIVPKSIGSPGCATAYATFREIESEWTLQEQKVTICPN